MTIPPCWWLAPDKQPGDIVSAAKPYRVLVQVHDSPLASGTCSPRRGFGRYVILPVILLAAVMAVITAHSLGIF